MQVDCRNPGLVLVPSTEDGLISPVSDCVRFSGNNVDHDENTSGVFMQLVSVSEDSLMMIYMINLPLNVWTCG